MSPDPFFQPDAYPAFASCSEAQGCNAAGGFCGACIDPECLRVDPDGSVRVGLSTTPEEWFAVLHALGPVLHLTRNTVAVLGQIASVPALTDWRKPSLPREKSGRFAPNLAEYARIWAVREPSPFGPAYGFEACDVSGHAFHRFVLTAPANRECFERFVTEHQSPPEQAATWFPPNYAANSRRQRALNHRIPFLRSRHARDAEATRSLTREMIPALFQVAAAQNLALRTTHYTPALVRTAVWTPQTREHSGVHSEVNFIHGEQAGLHLLVSAIGSAWLWQSHCTRCDQNHWTVELGDIRDGIALAISAGEGRFESTWREILSALLRRAAH